MAEAKKPKVHRELIVCPHCREEYVPRAEDLAELGVDPDDHRAHRLWRAVGCDKCAQRGYMGRTGIFELLVMTPRIQALALRDVDSNVIKREARRLGMRTLREDGVERALLGMTTFEEIVRVTRDDPVEAAVEA